ncbi:hypothetical protein QR685DRAFT_442837 [Neurospora intermedia]|uniref:Secreted protein n=1 Tax=Neurospora intermedia TaxID=5142 RepID=A0ABR3DGL1_NEUIN
MVAFVGALASLCLAAGWLTVPGNGTPRSFRVRLPTFKFRSLPPKSSLPGLRPPSPSLLPRVDNSRFSTFYIQRNHPIIALFLPNCTYVYSPARF